MRDEVIRLWHLAKVALAGQECTRFDRLQWTLKQYLLAHPDARRKQTSLEIDSITRDTVAR